MSKEMNEGIWQYTYFCLWSFGWGYNLVSDLNQTLIPVYFSEIGNEGQLLTFAEETNKGNGFKLHMK